MDLIYGTEISFSDGFTIKPHRTFVVNTNAPLHTSGFEVPPSAGVATFAGNGHYADRIISWRAIGQKLFLEERSLLYTISDGSLCLDFSRTPILPGTSITISDRNVLSIVVPTASTIHCFRAQIGESHQAYSILFRVNSEDLLGRHHISHAIATNGRPTKASVTQHIDRITVAYCMAEGQLVIVNLDTDSDEKHDEIVLGDSGFLQRMWRSGGGSGSNSIADVSVMKSLRHSDSNVISSQRKSTIAPHKTSDVAYTVTRDGWLQTWNVETQRIMGTLDLNEYSTLSFGSSRRNGVEGEHNDENEQNTEATFSLRSYRIDKEILLLIGVVVEVKSETGNVIGIGTSIHLVRAGAELTHLAVYEKDVSADERLVDFAIIRTLVGIEDDSVDMDDAEILDNDVIPITADSFNLTVMFRNASTKKEYVLRRISFGIDWKDAICYTRFGWHDIGKFNSSSVPTHRSSEKEEGDDEDSSATTAYNVSSEATIEQLRDIVFDIDVHSYDVVHRAVQIVCENFRGAFDLRYGNWSELWKHVESYINSVEFNRKFQKKNERGIRLKTCAEDALSAACKTFWWALLNACEELQYAARGAIALAPIQIEEDMHMMTLVHKDRMTVIGDNNPQMLNIFRSVVTRNGIAADETILRHEQGMLVNTKLVQLVDDASQIADARIRLMNRERNGGLTPEMRGDEELAANCDGGYDYEADGQSLEVPQSYDCAIEKLAMQFVKSATYDNTKPFGGSPGIFGGSFAQSLVAANIRVTVEKRVQFALTLRALLTAMCNRTNTRNFAMFGDKESLRIELREIIRVYRELVEQMDVRISHNGAKVSLGTWLTCDEAGLKMVRTEGGYGSESMEVSASDFNSFVGDSTESAVRALLSSSEVFVLARRLVATGQFRILLSLVNNYIHETMNLRPVLIFYRGIAHSGVEHPVKALASFEGAMEGFEEGNVAVRKAVLHFLPRLFKVEPGQDPITEIGLCEYYLTVVRFLQDHGHTEEVVTIAMKAIETLPHNNESVQLISNTLFNHLTQRKEWAKALRLVLRSTQEHERRRAAIRELLSLMISNNHFDAITTMIYGQHEQVVEEFLRERASRQNPSANAHLYEVLYAFYVTRKDYRMAASAMYDYARHIQSASEMTLDLLRKRRNALAACLNMQSVLGIEPEEGSEVYDDWQDTSLIFPVAGSDEVEDVKDCNDDDEIANDMRLPTDVKRILVGRRFGDVLTVGDSGNNSSDVTTSSSSGATSDTSNDLAKTTAKLSELKSKIAREQMELEDELFEQTKALQDALKRKEEERNGIESAQDSPGSSNQENVNMEDVGGENDEEESTSSRNMFKNRKRVIVLGEQQIREEWLICAARVGLISSGLYDGIPPTDPKELLSALTETCLFDAAFDVARQFYLDTYQLYFTLVREAIMIDALGDQLAIEAALSQMEGWVRTNRRHCDMISSSGDHWAVVRGLISVAREEWPDDSRPLRGATEGFLSHGLHVPCWLHSEFVRHDPADFLRCLIDFDHLSTALQIVVDLVDAQVASVKSVESRTWLPYAVIDELLRVSGAKCRANVANMTISDEQNIVEISKLRRQADEKLVVYFKKVESFEKAHKLSQKNLF